MILQDAGTILGPSILKADKDHLTSSTLQGFGQFSILINGVVFSLRGSSAYGINGIFDTGQIGLGGDTLQLGVARFFGGGGAGEVFAGQL